jgi:hypothetical protein
MNAIDRMLSGKKSRTLTTDKLEQEEETENKMMQETNPVEGTYHLFDQMT